LNFHEFVSNPQPLGFTGVAGKPLLLRPLSGVTPTHLLPVGVRKRWGNPHILRKMLRDAFSCLSRVKPHLSQRKVLPFGKPVHIWGRTWR